MKNFIIFIFGVWLSWLITADHYGRIVTETSSFGLMCRIHGLDTVSRGSLFEQAAHCIDLTYATPEKALWDEFYIDFKNYWSMPR